VQLGEVEENNIFSVNRRRPNQGLGGGRDSLRARKERRERKEAMTLKPGVAPARTYRKGPEVEKK